MKSEKETFEHPEKLRRGQIHFVHGNNLWLSHKNEIFFSQDNGESWIKVITLPFSEKTKFSFFRPLARLMRSEVNKIIKVGDYIIIFGFGMIYKLCGIHHTLIGATRILSKGRPLVICGDGHKHIYYGDYHTNKQPQPNYIYGLNLKTLNHKTVYQFDNIRHIHGVHHDQKNNQYLVTTGDKDNECGIHVFDANFNLINTLVNGSQFARAVELVIDMNQIYYVTDAPDEQNYLIQLSRDGQSKDILLPINGPVFEMKQISGDLIFSNVCEPSRINETNECVLWRYRIKQDVLEPIYRSQKDILHMRLFQYGMLRQPIYSASGQEKFIFFTEWATQNDYQSYRIPI